jgi:hypothetical protein
MRRSQAALALGSLVLFVFGAACSDPGSPQAAAPDAGPDAPPEPPPEVCPAGRVELPSGECVNAGVPADGCGEGFVSDGNDGCAAVAPAGVCPEGLMAIPGETVCREIGPCGDGDYGAIPVDAMTQYVNQAYAGGGSDGSKDKPWTTIKAALDVAPAGGLVAVAAGTYNEDLTLSKPVRLWGRCASLVEIHGLGAPPVSAALTLELGAVGSEIHDIAVTSVNRGVALLGAKDVVFDRFWLHNLGRQGLYLLDTYGTSSATVKRSLIEEALRTGIYAGGSAVTLEESVVRETKAYAQEGGLGIYVEATSKDPPKPTGNAKLVIRRSLIEKNHTLGVHLRGGDGTIESTLIRDTQEEPLTATFGVGLYIDVDTTTGERAKATVQTSVIERNIDAGVFIHGADVTLDRVVVRDTASQSGDNRGGRGVNIDYEKADRSFVTIQRSLIERSVGSGLFVAASEVTVEATVIRDTATELDGRFGFGVATQPSFDQSMRSALTMRSCRVERTHVAGIMALGTDTTIEHTAVTDTLTAGDGSYGDGIALLVWGTTRSSGNITRSSVTKSARAGISNFSSDLSIQSTVLNCNPIHLDGEGDDFTFSDGGENLCKCDAQSTPCKVLSANLKPPEPF